MFTQGRGAGARHRREPELLPLPPLRRALGNLRPRRRPREADKLGVPFLGEVPLHLGIRTTSEQRSNHRRLEADSALAQVCKNVSGRVWKQLSANQRGARKAPNIVVQ